MKNDNGTIRLLPFGGLGEIGLNLMALEYDGKLLIIDCGLMFPEPAMLGVDLVVPEIGLLTRRSADIVGLVLTHGHEDHIGAASYLWRQLGKPEIYATALTIGLLQAKLREFNLSGVTTHVIRPRDEVILGPFQVEFFRAAHSIVDGVGLGIRTPAGLVVHTGDFKLDPTPVDGETTDLARLAAYGEEGVLLLLSDSTNVERDGYTLSEQTVGVALHRLLPTCSRRIYIGTFSSHIARICQVLEAAQAHGRKVLIHGRSMVTSTAVARQLGYLNIPDDLLINLSQLKRLPPEQTLVLTTGSQGEPLSVLARMARDDHAQLQLEEGDTVILSSRQIPGNEKAITDMINHLYRRGAEVHYETTSEIHVSGHACREELKQVLALTRPQSFVPIHGEYRHLVKHARLAVAMGVAPERALVLENGQSALFSVNGASNAGTFESGRIFVDGKGVGDVGAVQLRDRSHLAHHGLVVALLAVNRSTGVLLYGPELFTRGFVPEEERGDYLAAAAEIVRGVFSEHSVAALTDLEELRIDVRKALRRFFIQSIERRPLILPVVLEL
ncbi:MAG: ribonuclease J [Desulfuromonadales bacterium]|nr:ribonuclease J [Desulfuromonadales bacterium]